MIAATASSSTVRTVATVSCVKHFQFHPSRLLVRRYRPPFAPSKGAGQDPDDRVSREGRADLFSSRAASIERACKVSSKPTRTGSGSSL